MIAELLQAAPLVLLFSLSARATAAAGCGTADLGASYLVGFDRAGR
jgi:hypothetical protein